MLTVKRKRLDRDTWTTITEKVYRQKRIDTDAFHGWAARLDIVKNTGVCDWHIRGRLLPVSRNGMFWLELLPDGEDFAVTEMHDRRGKTVFRYLDMIDGTGEAEDGVRTFDDLFLDVIASDGYAPAKIPPFCRIDDREELDEALRTGCITEEQYGKALNACERVLTLLNGGTIAQMCRAALRELEKEAKSED